MKQNENNSQNLVYPSPILSSPALSVVSDISNISNQSSISENSTIYSNNNINYIYSSSPMNSCINLLSTIDNNESSTLDSSVNSSLSQSILYA
eukprot:jgi/Orpsp1_1/1190346/evm.model.d7180000078409.1